MKDINETKLEAVAQAAFNRTNNLRWQTAIAKAKREIESNPYIHYTGHSLLMLSESGEIYEANGVCQCRAFANGQPCYHRAAYKLVKRYMERSH
jgi:hypothetical protein